jgi:multiple antibiotic resistance protein
VSAAAVLNPFLINDFLDSFIRVFGSLFPIVNPFGTSFLFLASTRAADPRMRAYLAGRVAIYGFFVIVVSLYGGVWLLTLFGVSVPALRVGGGLVLMVAGWRLLNAPASGEDQGVAAAGADKLRTAAFYPLTMPLTTGPGTVAATIALGASPAVGPFGNTWGGALSALGALFGAVGIALLIYICNRFAGRLASLFGRTLTDALMRLFALLLLCVGVEILWAGLIVLLRSI